MQKAIIVVARWEGNGDWVEGGMEEVNQLLSEGWRVVSSTPMGGAAYGLTGSGYDYPPRSDIAFTSMMVLESGD